MEIKLRDDVVIEKVAGMYIAVAMRSAWHICPLAMEIGPMPAYFWQSIKSGISDEEMISTAAYRWKVSKERAEKFLNSFIRDATRFNYIISEDSVNE